MKKNIGTIDKVIRLLIAAVVVILYFTHVITGTLGIILLVVAGVFVLTTLINFCPIWAILGINTLKQEQTK
jgi:hypothetical protein